MSDLERAVDSWLDGAAPLTPPVAVLRRRVTRRRRRRAASIGATVTIVIVLTAFAVAAHTTPGGRVTVVATGSGVPRVSTTTSRLPVLPTATDTEFPKLGELIRQVRDVIRGTGDGGPVTAEVVKTTNGEWNPGAGQSRDAVWYGVQLIGDGTGAFRCTGRCQGLGNRPSWTSRYSTSGFSPTTGGADYGIGAPERNLQELGTVYELDLGLESGPCALLDASAVAVAVKGRVTSTSAVASIGGTARNLCRYDTTTVFGAVVARFSFSGRSDFDRARAVPGTEPLSGVGDEAFVAGKTQLFVRVGDGFASIETQKYATGGHAVLIELGRSAAARLRAEA